MTSSFRVLRKTGPYISCFGIDDLQPNPAEGLTDGAQADQFLAMADLNDVPRAYVAVGSAVAFHLARHESFDNDVLADHQAAVDSLPAMLPGNVARGLAVLDRGSYGLVLVHARTAADAEREARDILAAINPPHDNTLTIEETWDALSPAARLAAERRTAGNLQAALIAFRGRGRATGPINPDLLIRYRVSEWR